MKNMIILNVLWFFLPAYAANSTASLFKIKFLNKPISKKIFGSHKTYSGFIVGTLFALVTGVVQRFLFNFDFFQKISFFNYLENYLLIGFLLGFGALFGDLIKSFFKRRIKIPPGKKWIPFDQIDYTLGALFFSLFIWQPSLIFVLSAVFLNLFLHIFSNHIGFWLGIRRAKW